MPQPNVALRPHRHYMRTQSPNVNLHTLGMSRYVSRSREVGTQRQGCTEEEQNSHGLGLHCPKIRTPWYETYHGVQTLPSARSYLAIAFVCREGVTHRNDDLLSNLIGDNTLDVVVARKGFSNSHLNLLLDDF